MNEWRGSQERQSRRKDRPEFVRLRESVSSGREGLGWKGHIDTEERGVRGGVQKGEGEPGANETKKHGEGAQHNNQHTRNEGKPQKQVLSCMKRREEITAAEPARQKRSCAEACPYQCVCVLSI